MSDSLDQIAQQAAKRVGRMAIWSDRKTVIREALESATQALRISQADQRLDDARGNIWQAEAEKLREQLKAAEHERDSLKAELDRWRAKAVAVCPPKYGLSSPALDLVRELAKPCTPTKSSTS
jgi:hypothetical protein